MFRKSNYKRVIVACIAVLSFLAPLAQTTTTYAYDLDCCVIQKPYPS